MMEVFATGDSSFGFWRQPWIQHLHCHTFTMHIIEHSVFWATLPVLCSVKYFQHILASVSLCVLRGKINIAKQRNMAGVHRCSVHLLMWMWISFGAVDTAYSALTKHIWADGSFDVFVELLNWMEQVDFLYIWSAMLLSERIPSTNSINGQKWEIPLYRLLTFTDLPIEVCVVILIRNLNANLVIHDIIWGKLQLVSRSLCISMISRISFNAYVSNFIFKIFVAQRFMFKLLKYKENYACSVLHINSVQFMDTNIIQWEKRFAWTF